MKWKKWQQKKTYKRNIGYPINIGYPQLWTMMESRGNSYHEQPTWTLTGPYGSEAMSYSDNINAGEK